MAAGTVAAETAAAETMAAETMAAGTARLAAPALTVCRNAGTGGDGSEPHAQTIEQGDPAERCDGHFKSEISRHNQHHHRLPRGQRAGEWMRGGVACTCLSHARAVAVGGCRLFADASEHCGDCGAVGGGAEAESARAISAVCISPR
eukprot:2647306-Pleurochrysis_carterae.AAC.1